ncbi:MAG: AmmeMemoRadiSam system protein B [Acidobacteriota bacterium]
MRSRLIIPVLALAVAAAGQKVRRPAVAGAFYPAEAKQLSKTVDGLLARAQAPAIKEPLVALISPHAGYLYSGGVAAHGYALLKGSKPERVVVISPSHYERFSFSAVYDGDAYATPLGTIPVDKAFAARLATGPLVQLSSRGHAPAGSQGEHALEVQLPFLQRVLGQFKLVPVVMGQQDYDTSRALGLLLAKLIQGPDTLIVASSDLSHFHPYDDAVKLDRKTLRTIQEWDHLSLARNLEGGALEACGGGPIVAAMIAAERLGATEARLIKYANSGDVTGDKSGVVGYGALALIKAAKPRGPGDGAFSLGQRERETLLALARKTVETAVRQRKLYDGATPVFDSLAAERGAFVTLKRKGQLRGCIGYPSPVKPLFLTVRDVAAMAAVRDERFPPVTAAELGELEYEISVLAPLRRVLDVNEIQTGRDGLVVRKGAREGLLLPHVATEQSWDRMTFLQQTCLKAGLPPSAWQDPDTDIFSFTALVFGDHQPPAPPQRPAPGSRPPSAPPF